MKKRGLSDVVAVTLIILLSIAAVVIVWTFVRSTLEKTGNEITASCVSVNLRPVSCAASGAVTVENGAGEIIVNKVKLVYYDSVTGTSTVVDPDSGCIDIKPLERKVCTHALPGGMNQASVAAIVGDKLCGVSTEKVGCS